jgi:DNA-binding NarL/FixJ family response regulator
MLQLMAAGLGNKEIAEQLHLSLHTIRNHVQNVLAKLGAHSKREAVAIATREGLVDLPT